MWGELKNVRKRDLEMMMSAGVFFDAWGGDHFITASGILEVPFYRILAQIPELIVPPECKREASAFLRPYKNKIIVGLNIAKHPLGFYKKNREAALRFITELLKDPRVVILNFYTSGYKFSHWPRALSVMREEESARESLKTGGLWNIDAPSISRNGSGDARLFPCAAAGGDGLNVDPYGNAYLCHLIRKPKISLIDKSVINARKKLTHFLEEAVFTTDSSCKDCLLKRNCWWCPGRAYLEKGDMEAPVGYYCRLAKLSVRAA
jgi:radical SAM protein with 4Fe4S-binding SPASM domain